MNRFSSRLSNGRLHIHLRARGKIGFRVDAKKRSGAAMADELELDALFAVEKGKAEDANFLVSARKVEWSVKLRLLPNKIGRGARDDLLSIHQGAAALRTAEFQ